MALAVVLIVMIALIIADTFHSHWLHRLNPLQLFKRHHHKQFSFETNQINPNSSNDTEDTSTHFGLQNLGSTCYINSVLQGLYYCQSFRKSIVESTQNNNDVNSIILFQELFQKLSGQSSTSLHGATRQLIQYLKINPMIQEDAQEFYLKLLDSLNKDTSTQTEQPKNQTTTTTGNKTASATNNGITSLFTGYTESYIRGVSRDFYKTKRQKFYDLSLEVSPSSSFSHLYHAIHKFLTPVILDGENRYNTKEYGLISVEKGLKFTELPKILSVQLNRFTFDVNTGDMEKLGDKVEFPTELDMSAFVRDSDLGIETAGSSTSTTHQQQVSSGTGAFLKQQSVKSNPNSKLNDVNKYVYDLKSLIIHIGTPTVGHYIAIVRPSPVTKPDYWVLLDDDRVSVISREKMEEIAFGGSTFTIPGMARGGVSSTAYMLLYEQKV